MGQWWNERSWWCVDDDDWMESEENIDQCVCVCEYEWVSKCQQERDREQTVETGRVERHN